MSNEQFIVTPPNCYLYLLHFKVLLHKYVLYLIIFFLGGNCDLDIVLVTFSHQLKAVEMCRIVGKLVIASC